MEILLFIIIIFIPSQGERGGSVVECRTPEREVGGSKPTVAVLCPWARHFTPRKYLLITQEAVAPSQHDWKIVDWDVKPQHNYSVPCLLPLFGDMVRHDCYIVDQAVNPQLNQSALRVYRGVTVCCATQIDIPFLREILLKYRFYTFHTKTGFWLRLISRIHTHPGRLCDPQ